MPEIYQLLQGVLAREVLGIEFEVRVTRTRTCLRTNAAASSDSKKLPCRRCGSAARDKCCRASGLYSAKSRRFEPHHSDVTAGKIFSLYVFLFGNVILFLTLCDVACHLLNVVVATSTCCAETSIDTRDVITTRFVLTKRHLASE